MKTNFFWFRRDLRIDDNHGLFQALQSGQKVQALFIFDTNILDKLEDRSDPRVQFIHSSIKAIDAQLRKHGSSLLVKIGDPIKIWKELIEEHETNTVYCNRDYEPYAIRRDKSVYELLSKNSIDFKGYKDQVIFDRNEVLKKDGTPYTVYTPYSRVWKSKLLEDGIPEFPLNNLKNKLANSNYQFPSLSEVGFSEGQIAIPSRSFNKKLIEQYGQNRDIPGIKGTSRLGVHLRFGTISPRKLLARAQELSPVYVNELCWRDFYHMIIYHFPHAATSEFKMKYEGIPWRNNEKEFKAWCDGKTGYPMVDAGMRELNTTGFMHNRVRMIVASFLVKHLLIDWRWGEQYFANKLLDFDLAANNGGWQWASGTGCDAAPYFRIFNPHTQYKKFDPDKVYVSKWIPELESSDYPNEIVEHKFARERALATYKKHLSQFS